MQAIILVGGLGTRLRAVLPDLPKPMAPIQGKPFLAYLLDYLQLQGIHEVVFAVHYKREKIQDFFKDKYAEIKISYVLEDELFGTGGAIAHVLKQIEINHPVFVLNGDTFVKLNYRQMHAQHLKTSARLSVALRSVTNCERYGSVLVDHNRIVGFQEKGIAEAGLINAGVYLIDPNIFKSFAMPKKFSFEQDFLSVFLPELKPQAYLTDDYFIDIGIPDDYQFAQYSLKNILVNA